MVDRNSERKLGLKGLNQNSFNQVKDTGIHPFPILVLTKSSQFRQHCHTDECQWQPSSPCTPDVKPKTALSPPPRTHTHTNTHTHTHRQTYTDTNTHTFT